MSVLLSISLFLSIHLQRGPSWDLSSRQNLHVVIRNPSIQQHSTFGAPHIFYEVETKVSSLIVYFHHFFQNVMIYSHLGTECGR